MSKKLIKYIVLSMFIFTFITPNTIYSQSKILEESISGNDRYETAALIASKKTYDKAILVNGDKTLADGLSASGLSGAINAPILLTKQNEIPKPTMDKIRNVKKIYIIGGEAVISKDIENQCKDKGIQVQRLSGDTREETSEKVANEICKLKSINKIFLVNGYKGEADAISISPIAARDGLPIILTNGRDLKFNTKGIKSYAIGGQSCISDNLVKKTNSERIAGNDRFNTNKKVIEKFYNFPKEFYLSKGYNLVDALTVSAISDNRPVVLVYNESDKSILKGATKLIRVGGISDSIYKECLNAVDGIKENPTSIIKEMQVSVSVLNVRSGPGTNYSKVGKLTKGTKVSIIKIINKDWNQIIYNGKIAYTSTIGLEELSNAIVLSVPYISQYPDMPLGCEATSLAQLLKYKGKDVSKVQIGKEMPYSPNKNPELGFVGSPFRNERGVFQSIYPQALQKTAKKYRPNSSDITGASVKVLEEEIRKGNPSIVWVSLNFKEPKMGYWYEGTKDQIWVNKNLHVVTVTGVDNDEFYITDPAKGKYTISKSYFKHVYETVGKRALVVR